MPQKPKIKLGLKKVIVAIGSLAVLTGTYGVARHIIDPSETVTQIIDGDSFKIGSAGQTVRLAGLNAPEKNSCYYSEATLALSKYILGKKVILKEPIIDRKYGRIIANVYLDGKMVNEYMVKNGFAVTTGDTGTQTAIVKAASDFARAHSLGIYGHCIEVSPPDPHCQIKTHILDRGPKEERNTYFLPDCDLYSRIVVETFRGERWFCSEKEALAAGFHKSDNCTK